VSDSLAMGSVACEKQKNNDGRGGNVGTQDVEYRFHFSQ